MENEQCAAHIHTIIVEETFLDTFNEIMPRNDEDEMVGAPEVKGICVTLIAERPGTTTSATAAVQAA